MKNDHPLVSIVIPCRNEEDHIGTALDEILAQDPPLGGFEVIVADGMSNDGTREIVLQKALTDSRIRMIDNQVGFVSNGLNAAIREAKGSIIVRMDAHTSYATDYVYRCVEVMKETSAENVGGPWIACGKGKIGKAIAAAFQSPFSCGGARGHNAKYSGPVDTVYLGCWRREVFDRIGFFDEELVRNQDDEFNLRALEPMTQPGLDRLAFTQVHRMNDDLRAAFARARCGRVGRAVIDHENVIELRAYALGDATNVLSLVISGNGRGDVGAIQRPTWLRGRGLHR